jgi:hypothetical protein
VTARRTARCPVCNHVAPVRKNGTFGSHKIATWSSTKCLNIGGRAPGASASEILLGVLYRAFWDYYALDSQEWGPDRDNESAAAAALAALQGAPDFAVLEGKILLVSSARASIESPDGTLWNITTIEHGGMDATEG